MSEKDKGKMYLLAYLSTSLMEVGYLHWRQGWDIGPLDKADSRSEPGGGTGRPFG